MVALSIKDGSRYKIRGQNADEERGASSFDNSQVKLSVKDNEQIERSKSDNNRNEVEKHNANHMRILAEAVLKLRRRNEKLEKENKELQRQLQSSLNEKKDETVEEPATSSAADASKIPEGKDEFTPDELVEIEGALSQASQEYAETLQEEANLGSMSSKSHESDFLAVSASASISECDSHAAEVENLHKVIEDNNTVISDLMTRMTELSETVKQNECTIGLMQAKLDEHKETISRINESKQDVLDQLEDKRAGLIELEKKLKEAGEEQAEGIRKLKDLEMSLTDRTFLAAELKRELNEAREEKAKMIARREEDVRKMVKEKMVYAEKYLRREVQASLVEIKRKEMNAVTEELLAVEERAREMREKISNGYFEAAELGSEGTDEIATTVPICESTSSGDENNEEVLDPWFEQIRDENKDRVLKYSPSDEIPHVPDVIHNLNDLQASLAFSESINDMTFSAIKEKVARANRMVVRMRQGLKILPTEGSQAQKTAGSSEGTASTSSSYEKQAPSLTQEWDDYNDEKRQKQEEFKSTFEREAANLASAIRKHTSMLGGLLEK